MICKGSIRVDQVTQEGIIVEDFDQSLTPTEIRKCLTKHFPNLRQERPPFYIGSFEGQKYAIRCFNITYLGIPHPVFKKRIQIQPDLVSFYNYALENGAIPLLLGVYTYYENCVFVEFKIDTYINKKAHNSSAHVYSTDLQAATTDQFFQKDDFFGNRITAFTPDIVDIYLSERLFNHPDESTIWPSIPVDTSTDSFAADVIPCFESFFRSVPHRWHGIDCYQEMWEKQYKNKGQPEWCGFYLEFKTEEYINSNNLNNIVQFHQDKTVNGIDLDLFFPGIECYGDLKAHSSNSGGIQGNDWDTVLSVIANGRHHVYYIVCEHDTQKDSDCNYEVTLYWNQLLRKSNLMSYSKKMKNNVTLLRVYFLDINSSNFQYLSRFNQGINSNGKPRPPKISIDMDAIKHFTIKTIDLKR